jgi:GH18 family chitinase/microcystin-dependent protein
MASPTGFDPLIPIPNDPFAYSETWDFYTPAGSLVYGTGFTIDALTGSVSVVQVPPPVIGTVTSVTAGAGIATAPVAGITVSGQVRLAPSTTVTSGAYKNVNLAVDQYGKVTVAGSGLPPIYTGLGNFPISVTGAAPTLNVAISAATTTQQGATQLVDDLVTQDSTKALTAKQGYTLNQNINSIPIPPVEGQFYAGTFSVVSQTMQSVSVNGQNAGFVPGASLPYPGGTAVEGFVTCVDAGLFSPPGGGGPYAVKAGDQFYCGNTQWLYVRRTLNYPYATTTTPGLVQLATQASVIGFTNNTFVCTPFSLANLDATTTERGWVYTASDLETQTLLSPLKAVTPANLNALPATLFDRGIVQLNNSTSSTSTTQAATANSLNAVYVSAILKSQITAVGDIIAGQNPGIPYTVHRGSDKQVLYVDDTAPAGVKWAEYDPPSTVPVGTIMWFATNNALKVPANWIVCDGSTKSALANTSPGIPNPYYDLFKVIGYTYGGSGNTFSLPDLRGKFVRGWSGSGGTAGTIDNPRIFASTQTSATGTHTHPLPSLSHNHPVIVNDAQHNHRNEAATVIGPFNGYFGNKDTGPDAATDGTNGANISMTAVDALTTPKYTLTNTAPTPTDETKPVNFSLVPIIKYTYAGETPAAPQPGFYYVSATPTAVGTNATITTNILTANVPRGTTLYWELGGPGVVASLFSPAVLTGTTTVGMGNLATFNVTTAASFPNPPYSLEVKIYSDAARLNPVGNTAYVEMGGTYYTVAASPTAATNNKVITTTISTVGVADSTPLYWEMTGTGVTPAFFTSNTLTGSTTVTSNLASFNQTLAATLPGTGPYSINVNIYSDAARTNQVGSTALIVSVTPNVTPTTPQLGAYIDLWQYRNTDATYPYVLDSGLNPVVRASNIKANALSLLDKFYILTEVQLNGNDSKLYFGNPAGLPPAAQVLNAAGTDWNTNTGSPQGTYVSPTNPDYTYSAWALKNTNAYMTDQTVSRANYIMCVGGYLLSNNMDLAGATPAQATAAASQIVTLMNLCGAKGVDIDYEPVGLPCNPTRMATLMQAIYTAVKAVNPAFEVHLTLIPSLSVSDPDLKIATAVACQAYADQINIMTYDDPNDLGQPPYEPGTVTVYNHTGVDRSVQSVQWFINAGVPRAKLGLGIGLYARNSASPAAAFNAGNPVPYSQIVASANAAGQTTNSFPVGQYLGVANIQNPNPTNKSNYYGLPTSALWAFDSVNTISDKVKSASSMGLRAVFAWQISNDYADATSALPAGNARANFALLKAARQAIATL